MKDFEFPFAKDKSTGKSSATLFFAYVAFLIAVAVTINLAHADAIAGATAALILFFGSLVLYRLKQIDKLKVDLQNRSLEIEDLPETPGDKNEPTN